MIYVKIFYLILFMIALNWILISRRLFAMVRMRSKMNFSDQSAGLLLLLLTIHFAVFIMAAINYDSQQTDGTLLYLSIVHSVIIIGISYGLKIQVGYEGIVTRYGLIKWEKIKSMNISDVKLDSRRTQIIIRLTNGLYFKIMLNGDEVETFLTICSEYTSVER